MEAAAHESNQRSNTHVEILNSASTLPVSLGKCKNQQQQKSSKKPTSSSSNALCVPKLGRWGHYANTLHWFIKTLPQPDNKPSSFWPQDDEKEVWHAVPEQLWSRGIGCVHWHQPSGAGQATLGDHCLAPGLLLREVLTSFHSLRTQIKSLIHIQQSERKRSNFSDFRSSLPSMIFLQTSPDDQLSTSLGRLAISK